MKTPINCTQLLFSFYIMSLLWCRDGWRSIEEVNEIFFYLLCLSHFQLKYDIKNLNGNCNNCSCSLFTWSSDGQNAPQRVQWPHSPCSVPEEKAGHCCEGPLGIGLWVLVIFSWTPTKVFKQYHFKINLIIKYISKRKMSDF